ncbi:MAG: hypothetical protein NVS3B21_30580 [Acidimicrobiales bacterium]
MVKERLGVAPMEGGVHDGFGTRNALVGLGPQYLEVLSLDPQQTASSPLSEQVRALHAPRLLTVAVATSGLVNPVRMSRVRPDGVRLQWEVEFTSTPLFFIDWKDCPRPTGLPDGGLISSVTITTPNVELLEGVDGVTVRQGTWLVEAAIDGRLLV